MWRAEPFEAFCRRLTQRLSELRQHERATVASGRRESVRVEQQIAKLVQALKDGIPASVVKDELVALERRRSVLTTRPTVAPQPRLHPDMGERYRAKVTGLLDALSKPESRPHAASLLRGFVDEIRLTPTDGTLTIAVKGNLAGVLAVAGLPTATSGVGCGGGI